MGSTALSKTSYGLTLLRLMSAQGAASPHRKLRWLIIFFLVSINLVTWPTALVPFVACQVALSAASRQCWASAGGADIFIGVAGSGYSGAADVILALLPLEAIWDQKMQHSSRCLVMFSMAMGFVAAVAAFIQCSQMPNNNTTTLTRKSPSA